MHLSDAVTHRAEWREIGAGIRYYPSRAGVSEDNLGRAIGLTEGDIDLVERGRRSLNTAALCVVARTSGTSPLTLTEHRLAPMFASDAALKDARPSR